MKDQKAGNERECLGRVSASEPCFCHFPENETKLRRVCSDSFSFQTSRKPTSGYLVEPLVVVHATEHPGADK